MKLSILTRVLDLLPGRRSFDAAAGGRRWSGAKTIHNLNQVIIAQGGMAARRGAYQARNCPWIAAGVTSLVTRIVGTGITPRSEHPDTAVRERLQKLWRQWVKHSDPSGRLNFYGQQALAVRRMIEGGESIARMRVRTRTMPGAPVPLQVETLDRTQLPMDLFRILAGGNVVRAGIEFSGDGERLAYHLFRTRPDDPYSVTLGIAGETVRVDARDILHLMNPLEDGQLRGATWLLPVIPTVHELDQMQDAALVRSKIANMLVGFVRDMAGTAGQLGSVAEGEDGEEELQWSLEPGQMTRLPNGTDVTFPEVPEFKDYGAFMKTNLRGVSAGLGVPYPEIASDYEAVTYSSARVDLMAYRARVEFIQHSIVIHQFCQPTWERFVTLAVWSGALDAPDFEVNAVDYLACEWLPPKFDHVDPEKDINAEVMAINNLLKSRAQSVAERGYDVEQVDAQIAADRAREAAMKLRPEPAPTPPSPPPSPSPPADTPPPAGAGAGAGAGADDPQQAEGAPS